MDISTAAYAAGFIDGEGSITATVNHIVVAATQIDTAPLEFLKEQFGGTIRTNDKDALAYKWAVSGKEAINCLSLTAPYLIVKLRQAEVGLQWPLWGRGIGRVPEEIRERRRAIQRELVELRNG